MKKKKEYLILEYNCIVHNYKDILTLTYYFSDFTFLPWFRIFHICACKSNNEN